MTMNRRDFIRYSTALGASSLLAGGRANAAMGTDYDVVIIGAGILGAGLIGLGMSVVHFGRKERDPWAALSDVDQDSIAGVSVSRAAARAASTPAR